MKLKKYKEALDMLIKQHPEALEYEVIYSHDDEGNEFQKVHSTPVLVNVENIKDDRFLDLAEDGDKLNAVIMN